MSTPPRVVIVGGGQAGAGVAQALAGIADVTLIDPKEYLEIQYANVRVPLEPGIVEGNCVPFKEIPRLGRVVTSTVTSVSGGDDRHVSTADGGRHPYDFLVLAPGVSYSDPLFKGGGEGSVTLEGRREQARRASRELEEAGSVVVVGGGPVGVELAAEIADANKGDEKKITLVTSADSLLHPKPCWVGAPAESWLRSRGVDVVKGQKVEEVGGGDESGKKKKGAKKTLLKTVPGGDEIEADVVYWCFNGAPNTSFLSPTHASALDPAGFIRVDQNLRVSFGEGEGESNWFALGDASTAPGVKLGYLARAQASTVASNIKSLIDSSSSKRERPNLPSKWSENNGLEMMLVTLGKNGGCGHVGRWFRFPGFAVAAIKGRDLFVGKTRSGLGVGAAPASSA